MLTVTQAAAKLHISTSRVRVLIAEGRIKATMYGKTYLIDPRALAAVAVRKTGRPVSTNAE